MNKENSIKKQKNCSIGVDIGGTNMKAVLLYKKEIVADFSLATPKDTLDHFFIMLKALVEPLLAKAKEEGLVIKGIGLGAAGLVDNKKGQIVKAPNLPLLNGVNLVEKISETFGLSASIDNDANCFLRAEMALGATRNLKNVFGLIIGTGLGGAWWFNGDIYSGSHQGAGEPGRMIVDCTGNEEEGEKILDLEEIYQKLTKNNPANLAQEAYQGDVLANKTYEEIGYFIGLGLANVVNLIDPEAIVIGGGVVDSDDLFLSEIRKTIKDHVMNPESKKIKVYISKLGKEAGAIGAALLAAKDEFKNSLTNY